MATVLRVGVVGLGRRWRRYRPALAALPDRFAVRAVCDQVRLRAGREARRLGCAACAGPADLLDRADVDALLLLDPQWYGLWPVEEACRAGKPVFCATPLEADEAHADHVLKQVQERGLPVLMEALPQALPAAGRLRRLLDTTLGKPRLLLCDQAAPRREQRTVPAPVRGLAGTSGVALLHWLASLLGSAPVRVWAGGAEAARFTALHLEFPDGRAAQLTRRQEPLGRRRLRLHVVAERGAATLGLPGRLRWTDADGLHALALAAPVKPAGVTLLEQFHRALTEGGPPRFSLADAHRVLGWLRAALRSRDEGRWEPLG